MKGGITLAANPALESANGQGANQPVQQPVSPNVLSQQLADLTEAFLSTQTIGVFRENTTWQSTQLNQATVKPGGSVSIQVPNNGLATDIVNQHVTVITLDNTSAAAQVVDLSTLFPFNMAGTTQLQINGSGNTPYSASGVSGLMVATRAKPGVLVGPNGTGPSRALVRLVAGAGVTLTANTAGTYSLSGYASLSVAANTTGTLTVYWYEKAKLAFSRFNPMGCLPLNNTQLNVQLVKNMNNLTGTNNSAPLYVDTTFPSTLTVTATDTINSEYHYWSTPDNPAVYQDFVNQIYVVNENSNLNVQNSGVQAFQYPLPLSQYVTALHTLWTDTNGDAVDIFHNVANMQLTLGMGTIVPVKLNTGMHQYEQLLDYMENRADIPGYAYWDGNDTANAINAETDSTGWFNTYNAANPQLVADVGTYNGGSAPSVPYTVSVTRESLVDGTVAQMYA